MGSYKSKHLAGTGSKEDPLAWDYSEKNPEGKDAPIQSSDLLLRGPNKHKKHYVIRHETSRGKFHDWVLERQKTWLLMRDKEYGTTPFLYQGVSTDKEKRHSPILVRDAWDWQKPCEVARSGCHRWSQWSQGRRYSLCSRCRARGPMGVMSDKIPWCEPGKKGLGWQSIPSLRKQGDHVSRYSRRHIPTPGLG